MSEELKLFAVSGICIVTKKFEGRFTDEGLDTTRTMPLPVTVQMALPVLALDEEQAVMMGLEHLESIHPPSKECYGHEVIAKQAPVQWYSIGIATGD